MRAAILYGKEDLRIEDVEPEPLKPGEVRLQVEAALTCGTDLKVYKRGYHARMLTPPAPFGHELAGRIIEIHPETVGWTVGELVVPANSAPCGICFYCGVGQENLCDDLLFLNGAYAESIVVPSRIVAKNMLRVPPHVSSADAALTEPFACVVQGAKDLAITGSERILIIGSGPIGLMFAALTTHSGCSVSLAGRGAQRLALAKKFGCKIFQVPKTSSLAEVLGTAEPYDMVIEAVGQPPAWEAAVDLVRKGGKVNFFGGCPSGTQVTLDTNRLHYSSITLLASFHHTPATFQKALALIHGGVVRASDFVTQVHRLADLPRLFQEIASGNSAIKTLVR